MGTKRECHALAARDFGSLFDGQIFWADVVSYVVRKWCHPQYETISHVRRAIFCYVLHATTFVFSA